MGRKFIITIDEQGEATVKTEGFAGKACLTETEKLLANAKSLGIETTTTKITPTSQMHVQEHQTVKA